MQDPGDDEHRPQTDGKTERFHRTLVVGLDYARLCSFREEYRLAVSLGLSRAGGASR